MSRPYPVDYRARRRLMEAQRAETDALRDVGKVARRLESMTARLDAVDLELAKAQSDLVAVSGLQRAAQLLEMDQRELRRRTRRAATVTGSGDDSPTKSGGGTFAAGASTRASSTST